MPEPNLPPNVGAVALQASAAGGVLWAMAKVFTVAFAPVPARKRDITRALVESAFAIVSALIGGRFVAPAIVRWREWHEVGTVSLVGLIVGLVFWQAIPILIRIILAALPGWARTYLAPVAPSEPEKPE